MAALFFRPVMRCDITPPHHRTRQRLLIRQSGVQFGTHLAHSPRHTRAQFGHHFDPIVPERSPTRTTMHPNHHHGDRRQVKATILAQLPRTGANPAPTAYISLASTMHPNLTHISFSDLHTASPIFPPPTAPQALLFFQQVMSPRITLPFSSICRLIYHLHYTVTNRDTLAQAGRHNDCPCYIDCLLTCHPYTE